MKGQPCQDMTEERMNAEIDPARFREGEKNPESKQCWPTSGPHGFHTGRIWVNTTAVWGAITLCPSTLGNMTGLSQSFDLDSVGV